MLYLKNTVGSFTGLYCLDLFNSQKVAQKSLQMIWLNFEQKLDIGS